MQEMIILGIDPGLQKTGWGVISSEGSKLTFLACGTIKTNVADQLAVRLAQIHTEITAVIEKWQPDSAAVEETFVNENAASALKLGQARGVALASPAIQGIPVAEYAANKVKKSVVGTGHADKTQIAAMIKMLLPKSGTPAADEADALAVAICHAHHAGTNSKIRAQGL